MKKNALVILVASALLALPGCTVSSEGPSSGSESSLAPESFSSAEESAESIVDPSSDSKATVSSDVSEESSSESYDSSEPAVKEYDIVAESDEGAKVTLKTEKATAGSEVHFTVTVLNGFSLGEVSAKAGTAELDLLAGFDGDYSFSMPRRGVIIKVSTKRKSYKLSVNDAGGFLKSVTQKKVGSSAYVALDTITEESEADEEGETSSSSYTAAEFGAEVLLSFNTSVANYELTGVSVNGVAASLQEGSETYSFFMDAEDTSVSLSYSYKSIAFELVDSAHISLSLFADSACKEQIKDAYIPYSTVYLKATPSSEDYGVKTIVCSYASSTGSQTSKDLSSCYEEETGLYAFTYPMASEKVTIKVTEYDLHAYKDAPFIGEYANLDFSYGPSSDYSAFEEKGSMKILESGDLVYARSESSVYTDYSLSSYEDNEGTGLIKLEKAGSYSLPSIAYSKNLLVYDSFLEGGVYSSNYLTVSLKKEKEDGEYSLKATQFKLGEVTYALACFYEGSSTIENVLVERTKGDYTKNTIHFGVEVEMLEGEFVNEEKAIFRVKEGETTLLSVGYLDEGGAKNRAALGEEYGTYLDSEGKSLYLNGSGNASYDGASYGYSVAEDGVSITLNSNDAVVTGSIDKTTMSFTVNKKEEASMPWMGKSYKGIPQYSSSDSDTSWSNTYEVAFSSEGNTLTWIEYIGGRKYYEAETEYTVENGNTIKTMFYNCANTPEKSSGASIILTYNASGDYFTAKGGVNGAYFNDTKLSLVS